MYRMLFILALYWCIDLISLPELLGLTKTREFLCILLLILQHSNSVFIDLIYLPDLLGLTETRVPLTRLKCRYLSLPKKKKKVKVSVDLVRHAETCGKQQQCSYTLHDVKQRVEIIIKASGRTWWLKPFTLSSCLWIRLSWHSGHGWFRSGSFKHTAQVM